MKTGVVIRSMSILLSISLVACSFGSSAIKKEQARTIRDLGEAYMREGDYTKALRQFIKAERIYAKDPFLQNDLGLAYFSKKDVDQAIVHFKKALKLKPDYAPARNNLGTAYLEKKNWKAAIRCFMQVKDDLLYATPHFPLTNLGFACYKLKDYDKAIDYYKQALDISPDFPKALDGLGLVYTVMGRYAEAIATLEKAVKAAPEEAQIYIDLGRAYKLNQEYNKAYNTFKKAAGLAKAPRLKEEAEEEAGKVWKLK